MTLNSYLLAATLFVFGFVCWANPNDTIIETSQGSILIFLIINISNILLNKYFKNPFLELTNLLLVIFFVLRIPFYYDDAVFSDLKVRSADLSKVTGAIDTLNIQLIIFTVCTLLFSPKIKLNWMKNITDFDWRPILNFSYIILFINCFYFFLFFKLGENNLPNVLAILFAIFSYTSVLIFLLPLLILDNIKLRYKLIVYFQLAIIIFLVMFTGSKSGIFQVIEYFVITTIAMKGVNGFTISLKSFFIFLALGAVGIAFFMIGTISNQINRGVVDAGDMLDLLLNYGDNFSLVINSVSYRIGYLDFYLDKSIQDVYFSAFNIGNYIKAIIDAVTPGINFFDVPLVSRAVYNNFFGESEGPNSEVVTIFAEAYHLMGNFSFLVYGFVFVVIRFFTKMSGNNEYRNMIKTVFILYIFFRYLLGIGIDFWIFGDVIYPYIFIISSLGFIDFYRKKFSSKNKIKPIL